MAGDFRAADFLAGDFLAAVFLVDAAFLAGAFFAADFFAGRFAVDAFFAEVDLRLVTAIFLSSFSLIEFANCLDGPWGPLFRVVPLASDLAVPAAVRLGS